MITTGHTEFWTEFLSGSEDKMKNEYHDCFGAVANICPDQLHIYYVATLKSNRGRLRENDDSNYSEEGLCGKQEKGI